MDFSAGKNLACRFVTPGSDPGVYLSEMMDGRIFSGRDS